MDGALTSQSVLMVFSMMIQASRLHFIGTWRTRYQNLVNAGSFGQRASALPAASSSGRPVIIHLDMVRVLCWACFDSCLSVAFSVRRDLETLSLLSLFGCHGASPRFANSRRFGMAFTRPQSSVSPKSADECQL